MAIIEAHESRALAWAPQRAREPLAEWEALIAGAPKVEVAAANEVPATGLLDHAAAAVLDGVVRLYSVTVMGRQLTVRYCRFGDIVGLSSAIAGPAGFRAEAVTPVLLAVLPTEALRDAALRDARFGWSLAQDIAAASIQGVRTLAGRKQRSTLSLLATHLLEWALPGPDGTTVVRANHQQLADASGTAREVVTRALSSLRDCGLVATQRGVVAILDGDALSRVAQGEEPREAVRREAERAERDRGSRAPGPSRST
ncbi:MAG: Crp/Fnr family transcriptional regulator [Candidatus Dormibacteraeota bacterium]|nr:Crp/Fnr family transcriptional regulator [Candidatus Dormibacteraeota bacterium]